MLTRAVFYPVIIFILILIFPIDVVFSQPANDDWVNAEDVTSLINMCSANAAYTTVSATADQSKGSCWSSGPNYSVWFKFTATSTSYMKVQVKVGGSLGSLNSPMVALWDSNLSELSCQKASSSLETDYYGLTAGNVYYISVDNPSGANNRGKFTLCLSDVPDYNYYEGAKDVSSLINNCSANAAYTTIYASPDRSGGSCWANGPNNNRWFKFTATSTKYIKVQVNVGGSFGTLQYPLVALWDASLSQLNCQNYQGFLGSIETDYYGLIENNTYYISVSNLANYGGTFSLCLSDVPDYNFYEGAKDVTSLINNCSPDAAYTTLNATPDRSPGSCWSNGPNYNRWFKFTATATAYIKVQVKVGGTLGTLHNAFVALWDETLTTKLNCQNYQGYTSIETDYYGLTAGQTYYISVDNYVGSSSRGTFTLCLSDVPDYNFYEGAKDVTSLINNCSANAAYTTLNATPDRSAGSCWSNGPNYNRWFKFTATSTKYMKVQLNVGGVSGTLEFPLLALWDANLTQLNCQNYQAISTSIETDYYGLTAGQTYYISVDNIVGSGYRGTFSLCLSDVPDYNFFEGAKDITSLINNCSANAAYTTINATPDRSAGSCWSNGPNYNRWFKFTATSSKYIKVQLNIGGTNGTMQYPFLALWDASLSQQLTCQNYQSPTTSIEIDYLGLTVGQTYYISVDNSAVSGYRGTFSLCLSDVPDYNYYEGAKDITSLINGCSTNAAYSTVNATSDRSAGSCWLNGPNYNRWFKFTATTKFIKVELNVGGSYGTMQYALLALWDASLAQQLGCQTYQKSSVGAEISYYGLTVGQTYYISVDNSVGTGYRGTFSLCLSDVPDYDYYEGANALTDLNNWCSADAAYTTLNATPDRSAGSCWGNGPNYNRWFKFTALNTSATIQVKIGGTFGTMRYPFVALWKSDGTSQLACTNQSGPSTSISLSYNSLIVGNTYYISVDNNQGLSYRGTFTLCITNLSATIFYSRSDGDWNVPSTWSNLTYGGAATSSTPGPGNIVKIQDNAITVTTAASCAEVNMNTGSANTSLTIDNSSLSINGNFVEATTTDNSSITTIKNNGTLSVSNDFSITRGGGNSSTQFNIISGSATIGRDMNWTSSAGTVENNSLIANNSTLAVGRDVNLSYSGGMKISLNFNGNSGLTVGRDLNFTSSAASQTEVIFNNSSTMGIMRNIVRGATPFGMLTFNNSSTLTFNSNSYQQTIPSSTGAGGDAINYNNVVFDNTSGFALDFTMEGVATFKGSLTLNNGIAQTTAANLIALPGTCATSIGNVRSYIDGPMTYEVATNAPNTIRNFPIGNNGSYRPAVLTVTHSNNNSVTYTAQHYTASAADLGYTLAASTDKVSQVRYWTINSSDQSNLSSANVTLYYGYGTSDGVSDLANLTVVKTIGAGTTWVDVGQTTATAEPGNIASGAFSSFSTFTLANLIGGTNVLPIVLKKFEGKVVNDGVELQWMTNSEFDSDYFTLEKSVNGSEFHGLLQVKGAGTTNRETFYSALDQYPVNGLNFYRLRQTDFDGVSRLFPTISVSKELNLIEVFPNPSNGKALKIYTPALIEKEFAIDVLNDVGNVVYSTIAKNNDLNHIISLDELPRLPAGLYFICLKGGTKDYTAKVMISD